MISYSEQLSKTKCKSIYDIMDWCHECLPLQWKRMPWRHGELNHGKDLLESDEALNCYMSAYGDMHAGKCRAAMMNFPFDELNGNIEIVDWGCGQGIGAGVVLDVFQQRNRLNSVRRITVIEPSRKALHRAECNIHKIVQGNVEVNPIAKSMPAVAGPTENTLTSIGYTYTNIVHVFSNILDVTSIDLASVARMVASSHGRHYVICIGPKNAAAYRIEQFCSVFGDQDFFCSIDSVRFDRTRRTGHPYTCMARCFEYNGAPLDLNRMSAISGSGQNVYDEYDLRLQTQNNVLSQQKARIAYRLQSILSVDDILYIDPIINEVAVDFVIVRPNKGVILVNVFERDLNRCTLSNDKKEIVFDSITYQSPIDLISLCQTSIKDGIEELLISTIKDARNFSLIKKVVIFSENSNDEVQHFFNAPIGQVNYTLLFDREFIKDRNVCQNFFQSNRPINNISIFDDCIKRKIASIISPSWHSFQEGRVGLEPHGAQRRLVRSTSTQQQISGVAGSGKTYVLAQRAVNALKRTGGDVLILTYNITLANYLKFRLSELREDFSWNKIHIYHYHQFFRIHSSKYQLHVAYGSYDDIHHFENVKVTKRYSAIFVDEVQDYTTEWLRIVMQYFLEPNGEFVVFGDPKQNVYHRPLDTNGDIRLGVIGGEWNRQLNNSQRFANPRLANLAMAFQSNYMPQLPKDEIQTVSAIDNTLNFQIVTYHDMRSNLTLDALVFMIMQYIKDDGKGIRDYVVLASTTQLLRNIDKAYREKSGQETEVTFVNTENFERLKAIHKVDDVDIANWKFKKDFESLGRVRKQQFTTDKHCLKLSTVQSFKGWESPSVILILEDDKPISGSNFNPAAPETIYTAITRARENLCVVNIGNNTYHDFFRDQAI